MYRCVRRIECDAIHSSSGSEGTGPMDPEQVKIKICEAAIGDNVQVEIPQIIGQKYFDSFSDCHTRTEKGSNLKRK